MIDIKYASWPFGLNILLLLAVAAHETNAPLSSNGERVALPYNEFPGIDSVIASVMPVDFDILDLFGRGLPVYNRTWNKGKMISFGNATYSVPDQLFLIPLSFGLCSDTTLFFSMAFNLSLAYGLDLVESEDILFGLLGSASSSLAIRHSFDAQIAASVAVGVSWCSYEVYSFRALAPPLLRPDPDFADGVRSYLSPNPQYTSSIENWTTFLSYWKPFYMTSGTMGGTIADIWSWAMGSFNAHGQEWARAQASADFLFMVYAAGGAVTNNSQGASVFTNTSNHQAFWWGGDADKIGDVPSWLRSLAKNPQLTSCSIESIASLIGQVDPAAGAGAVDAINNVTALKMLQALLIPTLKSAASFISGNLTKSIGTAEAACVSRYIASKNCSGTWGSPCCQMTNSGINMSAITAKRDSLLSSVALKKAEIEKAIEPKVLSPETFLYLVTTGVALGASIYLPGVSSLPVCHISASAPRTCPSKWQFRTDCTGDGGSACCCIPGGRYDSCGCPFCDSVDRAHYCWGYCDGLCCSVPCGNTQEFQQSVEVPAVLLN